MGENIVQGSKIVLDADYIVINAKKQLKFRSVRMTSLSQKIIKPKLGLLELAKHLGNVSQACKTMGYSRDTFYRYTQSV